MLNSPDSRTIWITVANRFRASDGIAPHRYDTVHNGRPAAQLNNRRKIVGQIVVMLTSDALRKRKSASPRAPVEFVDRVTKLHKKSAPFSIPPYHQPNPGPQGHNDHAHASDFNGEPRDPSKP